MLVLKALDQDGAERTIDAGATFSMGRGSDNDWVLVDPGREISKSHCRIESEGSGFVLIDLSINGVLIDGKSAPMGPGSRHRLASGDMFAIGQHRFAVTIGMFDAAPSDVDIVPMPSSVSRILGGATEGVETRHSGGVPGEAEGWLGTLPKGAAQAIIHEPMGWDDRPPTDVPLMSSSFEQPASDFANRSEHVPATSGALHLPRSRQVIPMDWLDGDDAPVAPARNEAPPSPLGKAVSKTTVAPDIRLPFAEGSRASAGALAGLTDEVLVRRCGEALRACLDGLDAVEAAQAVAERDCGLPSSAETELWTDFFATNRDPLVSLLAEAHPGPAQMLAQRVSALVDRQRALGHAVADAAARYDARLTPQVIEAETKSRFRVGPLAESAAWKRFVGLHGELMAMGNDVPGFLLLLRKSFTRAMAKRP